ncbi:MAG: hypothetical protein JSS49_09030 [Planctomycetes bacterium]|nr:hypothetical protein [Planctomycetota bacterium]
MLSIPRSVSSLLVCGLLLTTVGCSTLDITKIDWRTRKATARHPAIKVVCLWEPAEGRDPKGVPCQGFAGQILFLTNTSLPVSVDGDVRIYLFDDQGQGEEAEKPLHQFDFDSGSWAQHYTYGTLGPAYNVFVPYMRRGVYDATCALRIRLTPKNGPVVFSEMTSIGLMGFDTGKSSRKAPLTDSRVEQTIPEDLTSVNKRRKTTTISLNGESTDLGSPADDPNAGKVQLAGYETESRPRPMTDDDARIAQLEQMVQELRAAQAAQPPIAKPATPAEPPLIPTPPSPPRRLDEIDDGEEIGPQTRIKLRGMSNGRMQAAETDVDSMVQSSARKRPNVVTNTKRRHPLDDEAPAVVTTPPRTKTHPLNDFDDEPDPVEAVVARPRQIQRHPLDEPDDDPVRSTATRKPYRSTEAPPQSERERDDAFDPFDPIDTEFIETTAVDDNKVIRQQLRAAR